MLCAYSIGAPIRAGQIYREKHYHSLICNHNGNDGFIIIVATVFWQPELEHFFSNDYAVV